MEEQNKQVFENDDSKEESVNTSNIPNTKKSIPKTAIILGAIAVAVVTIVVTLIILLGGNNSNNDNSGNNGNNGNGGSTTVEDCTTTGIHVYENGKCIGCKIKIFEVIKDYIIANADPQNSGGGRYLYYCGSYTNDTNFTIFEYNSSSNCIIILSRMRYLSCTYSTDIYFTPYSLEDGEYEWDGECIKFGCKDCTDLSGTLDPAKFSKSTTKLSHTSSASNADRMSEYYAKSLKTNLDEEIIPFLKNVGYNITIKDLGFTRYQ